MADLFSKLFKNVDKNKEKLKFSLTAKKIYKVYSQKPKLNLSLNTRDKDDKSLKPFWFRLLESLSSKLKITKLNEFISNRLEIRDYTLPLPKYFYDKKYKTKFSALDRNRMLNVIQDFTVKRERSFLMRLRQEKYVNQYYKHILYDLASKADKRENIYKDLYNLGFGFEFSILASGYTDGLVDSLIKDLQVKLEDNVKFETIFQNLMRSLKFSIVTSALLLIGGYFLTIYSSFYMIDAEYKVIPIYFKVGLDLIESIRQGEVLPLIIFILLMITLVRLADYYNVTEYLLISYKPVREMLMFFETYKFFTALDISMDSSSISGLRRLKHSSESIGLAPLKEYIDYVIEKASESRDEIYYFFTSNSIFKESDIVYLIDTTKNYTDAGKLQEGVKKVLKNKKLEFSIREDSDKETVEAFGLIISNIVYVLIVIIYSLGELQTMFISMGV